MRYTVMTYLMGNYERLHEVEQQSPHARYLCITDREDLKSDTWKIICDKTLIGSALNKTRFVKWHPWNYTQDEVIITIDGSIGVNGPLDELVEAFQGHDLCMMIHPERSTVKSEIQAWMDWRGLNPDDGEKQLSLMEMAGYSINGYRGLYQCCFRMMRRTPALERWLETVAGLLTLCGKHGEYATPEQVLASFALNKFFSHIPALWVSERLLNSKYLSWYFHNSDIRFTHQELITPYAFNQPVKVWL